MRHYGGLLGCFPALIYSKMFQHLKILYFFRHTNQKISNTYALGMESNSINSVPNRALYGEPRRRGRPRSINRSDLLPNSLTSSSVLSYSSPGVQISGNCITLPLTSTMSNSTLTNISTTTSNLPISLHGYSSGPIKIEQNLVGMNSYSSNNLNVPPKSIMVEVDSMLQDNLANKRPRKYKKKTPELNPDTGEPIKKPRKKGSGRKSKKELLLIQAAKESPLISAFGNINVSEDNISTRSNSVNYPPTKASIQTPKVTISQFTPTATQSSIISPTSVPESVSMFSRLAAEERNIVALLCKIKTSRTHDVIKQQSKAKILSFLEASQLENAKTNVQN